MRSTIGTKNSEKYNSSTYCKAHYQDSYWVWQVGQYSLFCITACIYTSV